MRTIATSPTIRIITIIVIAAAKIVSFIPEGDPGEGVGIVET